MVDHTQGSPLWPSCKPIISLWSKLGLEHHTSFIHVQPIPISTRSRGAGTRLCWIREGRHVPEYGNTYRARTINYAYNTERIYLIPLSLTSLLNLSFHTQFISELSSPYTLRRTDYKIILFICSRAEASIFGSVRLVLYLSLRGYPQ